MTKSKEIQIRKHMETNFLWKIAKSRPFEAKGFLNNYVFFITNKESPLMKDDLGSVWGPTQRTPKNFRKEKSKVKNRQSLAKAIHIHGASPAGRQPKAKTRQMGSNRDIAFPKRKVRKIKFGIGNHKSIGQAQAQKHASRQGKNHAENSKPSSR